MFIDRKVLAKQGDSALGSVRPSVRLCVCCCVQQRAITVIVYHRVQMFSWNCFKILGSFIYGDISVDAVDGILIPVIVLLLHCL